MPGHCHIFIVRCSDGSLFTGVTDNLDNSVRDLNDGRGTPYTRSRLPVFLAHSEEYMNEKDAIKRADGIKRLSRNGKEDLLASATLSAVGGLAFGV